MIRETLIAVKWHRYYKRDQFLFRHYRHPEWVLFIIDKGLCHYNIGGVTGSAGRGDLLLIPARQPIEQVMLEPMRFHFIAFEWAENRGEDDKAMQAVLSEAPGLKLTIADQERFRSTSEQLRKIASLGSHIDPKFADHYANDLWLLGRMELRNEELMQRVNNDSLMEKAKTMIEASAFQPVVLKDIASSLYLSNVQFTRRFQATYRIKPMDYLTSVRLEKARTLLEETEHTIESVAQSCGYESRHYFCRIFTKHLKLSPSQYRRIHRV